MAHVVVIGSGFAGQTAAFNLRRGLAKEHKVTVITPQKKFCYIPSLIWVGIDQMKAEETQFELAPIYKKMGIEYVNGLAKTIRPDASQQTVEVDLMEGGSETVQYDYLVVATGPKLNFEATKGLGPHGGYSYSVCTPDHAAKASEKYLETIGKMKAGEKQKILIGTGHGTCTCQGAAFEYIHNVAFDLEQRGLDHMAEITWISNEQALGDFGVGGMVVKKGGHYVSGKIFAEASFVERGIAWKTGAHVKEVKEDRIEFETIDGEEGEIPFDFAMLLPPFAGVPMSYLDKDGNDITSELCAPNGFLKVDAAYASAQKPFEEWSVEDWPKTYRSPSYPNIFGAGIAFAPPHPISKPAKTPSGSPVVAAPPRTGMAAGIIGHAVANNIIDLLKGKEATHHASMGEFGAACIASMGKSLTKGSAAAIVMHPVIPDYEKYEYGRDTALTFGDMGLAGHWLKHILHHVFLWKMKGRPFWWVIPD